MLAKKPLMMPCEPVNGGNPVRHRALSIAGEMADREAHYFQEVIAHVQNLVSLLPSTLTCYLAVDTGEQFSTLPSLLQKSMSHPLVRIRDLTGLEILDYWLDCHYDHAAALLLVSAQLYEQGHQTWRWVSQTGRAAASWTDEQLRAAWMKIQKATDMTLDMLEQVDWVQVLTDVAVTVGVVLVSVGVGVLVVTLGVPEALLAAFLLIIRLAITAREALAAVLGAGTVGALATQ